MASSPLVWGLAPLSQANHRLRIPPPCSTIGLALWLAGVKGHGQKRYGGNAPRLAGFPLLVDVTPGFSWVCLLWWCVGFSVGALLVTGCWRKSSPPTRLATRTMETTERASQRDKESLGSGQRRNESEALPRVVLSLDACMRCTRNRLYVNRTGDECCMSSVTRKMVIFA